eukprot:Platyproteum_vivax@DN7559_c0_g1_i10.p1
MSVIGIDVGTQSTTVANVGKGIIDIVLNAVSERSTPTVVEFGAKERLVGDEAMSVIRSNYKSTCRNFKNLVDCLLRKLWCQFLATLPTVRDRSNEFKEKEPFNVEFFSMGHSYTYMCVAEFLKGKLKAPLYRPTTLKNVADMMWYFGRPHCAVTDGPTSIVVLHMPLWPPKVLSMGDFQKILLEA